MGSDGIPELWMIVAIIQPFKLDAVTLALEGLPGFGGMTVSDCRGFGRGKLGSESEDADRNRPREGEGADLVDFTAKIRLEVGVAGQDRADTVIDAIARAAHTGRKGDGKIVAWPVVRALRIRTLEEGAEALAGAR